MKKSIMFLIFVCIGLYAKPMVSVSVLPQKYFVEQIAGDTLDVNVVVPKGASPATYEPKPKQMVNLQKSDIYFAIGVPYEKIWVEKFRQIYPKLDIIKTDKGIKKRIMKAHHHHHEAHDDHDDDAHHEHDDHDDDAHHEHEDHDHDAHHDHEDHDHDAHHDHEDHDHDAHHEHEDHDDDAHHDGHDHHDHAGMADPHIWLDPILVKTQATTITQELVKKYPNNRSLYEKNLEKFTKRLDALDSYFKTLLKEKKGKKFLVYHPSWGYFADRYGLVQESIEMEGKEPKPKDLQKIINEAKEDGISVIFVQPQFSQKSAKVVASQIDGKVIPIDQLAVDWENEIKKSVKTLSLYLK